jgi:hypothetical protein
MFANLWVTLYPAIDLHSEYRFSPPRRYRWDYAHPTSKVAIEIQGGVWMGRSGHSGGTGLLKDYEKLNLAASLGWRVFLLTEATIDDRMLGIIAESIDRSELPNNLPDADLLGNSPTAKGLRQQRGYIGHIRPKTIKARKYYYWIYYECGSRVEKYMGVDRDRAVAKAKEISKQHGKLSSIV